MTNPLLDQRKITAGSIRETSAGRLLQSALGSLELPDVSLRYLYSGWQTRSFLAGVDEPVALRQAPWKNNQGRQGRTSRAAGRQVGVRCGWTSSTSTLGFEKLNLDSDIDS
jgi:hypothetical protein